MFDLPELPYQHISLMLDYDGTLTPIVANPADARITADKLNTLKQLAHRSQISLAIVSGRSVQQLEAFLDDLTDLSITLCGLHGGEIVQYPEKQALKMPSPQIKGEVAYFKSELKSLMSARNIQESVLLEDKGYSLALHYRQADEKTKKLAIECFFTIFNTLEEEMKAFRTQRGKEVLELVPRNFNKGSCVEFLMGHWFQKSSKVKWYPIYAGDDLTDESAFMAVNKLGGASIRIGEIHEDTKAQNVIGSINLLYYTLTQLLLKPVSRLG